VSADRNDRPTERPALARGVSLPDAFHLRPLARPAGEAPDGLPLAGGPMRFREIELSLARPGERTERRILDLAALRRWMDAAAPAAAARAALLLERLTAPRPRLPGLPDARPLLFGIVNATPDSFSDGGRFLAPERAVAHGRVLAAAGAHVIDVGGESTRPGAAPVPAEEELARVLPVVRALAADGLAVSIDSRRASVQLAAVQAGARLINDVSALTADPDALPRAAALGVPVLLMHSRADPQTMQGAARYDDVLAEVFEELEARIAACEAGGIGRGRLLVDPGLGFAKTAGHNVALLAGLALLHGLGCPLLVGASRKSFIGRLSAGEPAESRLAGSLVAAVAALDAGAQMLRVHDVAETAQAVALWRAIRLPQAGPAL